MRLLDLARVAKSAGLKVVEVDGWRTRGVNEFAATPKVIVVHADASSKTSGPKGGLNSVIYGSKTAPPPVGNFQIGRDGTVYVVASGVSNNAGKGNARAIGHPEWSGNSRTIGIEAANNNLGEPWPAVQYTAYVRLVSVLCKFYKIPASYVIGHKEWSTSGKSDPSFNMPAFRKAVYDRMNPVPTPKPPAEPTEPDSGTATGKETYIEFIQITDATGEPWGLYLGRGKDSELIYRLTNPDGTYKPVNKLTSSTKMVGMGSGLTAVSLGGGGILIAFRGKDGSVRIARATNIFEHPDKQGWKLLYNLGGVGSSIPKIAAVPGGYVVNVRGGGYEMWINTLKDGLWSGWINYGGTFA